MTTYNTGNPLGSTDPRDLYDNAENLDHAMNDDSETWQDRFGRSRPTLSGVLSGMESEFEDEQSARESEFRAFIASSGYQFLGDYASGIEITQYNQIIRDSNGEFWRVSGQVDLPYVTTGAGVPEDDALVLAGDAVLRQDLANPESEALIAGIKASILAEIQKKVVVNAVQFFDGIRTDAQALQAAVDYASSIGGATVFMENKQYVFDANSERVTLKDGVFLIGQNVDKTIIKASDSINPSAPAKLVNIPENAVGAGVANFTIDGNRQAAGSPTSRVNLECDVFNFNGDRCFAENIKIINSVADGFDVDFGRNSFADKIYVENCGGRGFHVTQQEGATARNNTFGFVHVKNCADARDASVVFRCDGAKIGRVLIEDNKGSAGAIRFQSGQITGNFDVGELVILGGENNSDAIVVDAGVEATININSLIMKGPFGYWLNSNRSGSNNADITINHLDIDISELSRTAYQQMDARNTRLRLGKGKIKARFNALRAYGGSVITCNDVDIIVDSGELDAKLIPAVSASGIGGDSVIKLLGGSLHTTQARPLSIVNGGEIIQDGGFKVTTDGDNWGVRVEDGSIYNLNSGYIESNNHVTVQGIRAGKVFIGSGAVVKRKVSGAENSAAIKMRDSGPLNICTGATVESTAGSRTVWVAGNPYGSGDIRIMGANINGGDVYLNSVHEYNATLIGNAFNGGVLKGGSLANIVDLGNIFQ